MQGNRFVTIRLISCQCFTVGTPINTEVEDKTNYTKIIMPYMPVLENLDIRYNVTDNVRIE